MTLFYVTADGKKVYREQFSFPYLGPAITPTVTISEAEAIGDLVQFLVVSSGNPVILVGYGFTPGTNVLGLTLASTSVVGQTIIANIDILAAP
jgi:hypothetical protein